MHAMRSQSETEGYCAMSQPESVEQDRRSVRRASRATRASEIERNQRKVGDAVNKIRTIKRARLTVIDEAYKSVKLVQWDEFVEAFDELWRGSAYIPAIYSHALDRIEVAIEKERALLMSYFESLRSESGQERTGDATNKNSSLEAGSAAV